MNKKEFVMQVAQETGLSQQDAEAAVSATFDLIINVMNNKDSINIPGFGSFSSKLRAARKGRNPSTGQEIEIPASIVAIFKAGTQLKAILNNQQSTKD